MDDTGAIDSMLVFRVPADAGERSAAARLLGSPHADRAVVYLLADVAVPGPHAAVMVLPSGRVWQVLRAGGSRRHVERLAADLVRTATAAGGICLVAPPDAPRPVRELFERCPLPVVPVDGWLTVEL